MRRALFLAGLVLGLLALAGLGAAISLVRSALTLNFGRSITA